MITQNKVGVWILDDTYKKLQSAYWTYFNEEVVLPTGCDWDLSPNALGSLWVWGYNSTAALGLNDTVDRSSPVQVPGCWGGFDTGGQKTIAIRCNGTLWGWGRNDNGDLGLNDAVPRSSPVQISGITSWNSVSASGFYGGNNGFHALRTDGSLWGAGGNQDGILGDTTSIERSSPVQIPGTWCYVCRKHRTAYGIKTDGTGWAWGAGNTGQIGNNCGINRSSPTQVPGTWAEIKAMTYGALGRKTDGTIWVWGCNASDLGLNDTNHRSSPTQLPGTYNAIATFDYGGAARKNDGTVVIWGRNEYGSLGLGDTNYRSSPVQLPGTWNLVVGGHGNLSAGGGIKSATNAYVWGSNSQGRLGLNNCIEYSSPVQLPGTWKYLNFGTSHVAGKK